MEEEKEEEPIRITFLPCFLNTVFMAYGLLRPKHVAVLRQTRSCI